MDEEWVHTPQDGRGRRRVLLNGAPIDRVVFADTKRGLVRVYDNPPKVDKHTKRLITRTLCGDVVVEPMDG